MDEDELDIDEDNADNQQKSSREARLLPFQWKKGQSGNPSGRPKGKTMKEYAKELLECQSEDERQEFLHGLPKEVIWKMAEGNPDNKSQVKTDNTYDVIATPELLELAKQLNDIARNQTRPSVPSDGVVSDPLDTKA